MRSLLIAILLAFSASSVFADAVVPGSTYFIAPGAGIEKGFQLAGGPFVDSTFDGISEEIGPDISGNGTVVSSEIEIQNSARNFDLIFRIETTPGGNLMPTGVIGDSGEELTSLGLFIGGGLNPVDLRAPLIANTAVIEVFDTSDQSIGTIDVIGLTNFSVGLGGGWDGTLGLNFGSQIPIGDVGAVELQLNYDSVVPEPATFAVLGVFALSAAIRRRR